MIRRASLYLNGALGLMLMAGVAYAGDPAMHHHHEGAAGVPKQEAGKKWETDAPLRSGMDHVRKMMAASEAGIAKNALASKDYQKLAVAVETEAASMLKNCKLGPEADKAFHAIVLADLTAGTELMRTSPKIQVQRAGALAVLQSLQNYGKYFQHPGWK